MHDKLINLAPKATQGTAGTIAVVTTDVLDIDVSHVENIRANIIQLTDAGTVVLVLEYTLNGTVWIQQGNTIEETGSVTAGAVLFPAGAGAIVVVRIATSALFQKRVKRVRLKATTLTGGTYGLSISGVGIDGFDG